MKITRKLAKTLVAVLLFSVLLPGQLLIFSQERFRRNPPYPEPLLPLRFPPIESGVLENGLKLVTITRLNSPIVTIQVLVQAGEFDSPPGLSGLATVTTEMMLKGTQLMSASDIEEALDTLGIEFNVEVKADHTLFTFSVLEENLDQALNLIKSFFSEPSFPASELINVKRELYYRLLSNKKEAEKFGFDFFLKKLLNPEILNPGPIEEEEIKNISQKDVIAFHRRLIRPNNSMIIISGNLGLNNASLKVSQAFNRWVSRPVERSPLVRVENKNFEKVFFVDLSSKDCVVLIGNTISPINGQDYFSLLVMNQIIGGLTSSRLFLNLRETKSLAFYAFSDIYYLKNNGVFWIRARTSPEAAGEVTREIISELKNLTEFPPDPLELERAKTYLIGNFLLQLQNSEQLSQRLALQNIYNLPDNFWLKYIENIMMVGADNIREAAQKYLSNKPLIIILGKFNPEVDYLKDFNNIEIYNNKGQLQLKLQKGETVNENRRMRTQF
ncbi:MAG: insulinase family protein [Candidatus Aminicenantes bacterium]|nr:insulinase family protein [Candidatus Aminicenantes bacterium]